MFWLIIGAIAVLFMKYYTSVGSRKLHRRINKVKLDLENARHRLKEVRESEYDIAQSEETTIQRVQSAKEIIVDLQLRLTLADDSNQPVMVENMGVAIHF
jgi:hypothetical protein